jgi:hypothetical protein
LDNIGMLVVEELVRPELIAGFIGTSVVDLWVRLRPSIEAERQIRRNRGESDAYQLYFEHLAVTMRQVDPAKVRAKLKRWDEPHNLGGGSSGGWSHLPLPLPGR